MQTKLYILYFNKVSVMNVYNDLLIRCYRPPRMLHAHYVNCLLAMYSQIVALMIRTQYALLDYATHSTISFYYIHCVENFLHIICFTMYIFMCRHITELNLLIFTILLLCIQQVDDLTFPYNIFAEFENAIYYYFIQS